MRRLIGTALRSIDGRLSHFHLHLLGFRIGIGRGSAFGILATRPTVGSGIKSALRQLGLGAARGQRLSTLHLACPILLGQLDRPRNRKFLHL
jgi:hypothetical protein